MKPEHLIVPVSDDNPCGPDLNETGDAEYGDYYFGALGRLPDFILRPGVERPDGTRTPDQVFDHASIAVTSEAAAIDALLARSRDIRLLALRAQWEMLAGRLGPMVEAVEGIAALLDTFPDEVHPAIAGGLSDRREAINDLNQPVCMVQALQSVGLVGSSVVTLRKLKIANGTLSAQTSDEAQIESDLPEQLSFAPYRAKVDAAHAAMTQFLKALARIEKACQTHAARPFSPALDQIRTTAIEILDAICAANTDLPRYTAETVAPDMRHAADGQSAEGQGEPDLSAMPAASARPAIPVYDHAHARKILEACEAYYRHAEPSSAALLLIVQARLLIGRTLLDALQTLMPAEANQARIDFGAQLGLQIGIAQLRNLTDADGVETVKPVVSRHGVADIKTAAAAAAAIQSVENHFRRHEKSSPVPLLLQRARSYLDRDFQSLVDELIPRSPASQS
ncbi:MAG: type VI secretion system ImpA family N-terminal domain-containing protein [Loktanella sp.]|nr:type VI secretion system ImpA family N-terminal domain-containing protein [Loktanella sp.]